MPSPDSTRWWLAAEAVVALAVASLPLCFGGAPPWTLWVVAATSWAGLGAWLVGTFRYRRRAAWHPVLWLPLALAVAAAVALVPLPPGLQEVLSPPAAALRREVLVPLGFTDWRPLSMDAPSTWRALVRWLSFAALCFTALQLGRSEAVRRRLLGVVALAGVVVAVVGFGHQLTGTEALFGVHRFVANVPLVTFFGNTNHLAGYLAFSGTVALALALEAQARETAVGWAGAAVACGLGVFLSFSRGGIASFVVTWAVVGLVLLARRQAGLRGVAPWLFMGATTLFAISLAAEQLFERMASVSSVERLSTTKLELWPMFASGALAFWRGGMGLGAFELAFHRHQTRQLDVTFTHPENLVLQWASELGLVLTVGLAALAAFVALRLVKQAKGLVLEQTVLLAVAGAGLHDVFDFVLEFNALPAAVAVVLGVCAAREVKVGPEPVRWQVTGRPLLVAAALALVTYVGVRRGLPTHTDAHEALIAQVRADAATADVRAAALAAIDRHPADWLLHSAMAFHLSARGEPREALAWVERVLFLRPHDPSAHTAAARAQRRLGDTAAALVAYTRAWRSGDTRTLDEGLALAEAERAFRALLSGEPGELTRFWERYHALGRLEAAEGLLEAALEASLPEAVKLEAKVLTVRQAQVRQRWAAAVAAWEALPPSVRDDPAVGVPHALTLARVGRADDGVALLEQWARRAPGNASVAMALVDLLSAQGRTAEARAALERARPFVSGQLVRSQLFQREADLWAMDERWPRALDALQTAARIEPTRADLRYRLAHVYERMGSFHSALDEVRRGRLLDSPAGAKAQDAWVERLEVALSAR